MKSAFDINISNNELSGNLKRISFNLLDPFSILDFIFLSDLSKNQRLRILFETSILTRLNLKMPSKYTATNIFLNFLWSSFSSWINFSKKLKNSYNSISSKYGLGSKQNLPRPLEIDEIHTDSALIILS